MDAAARDRLPPADEDATLEAMKVGVVDVGSNTVRLLVASVSAGEVRSICEERVHLGLGEEIVRHGRIRRQKLDELKKVARGYRDLARRHRVRELATVVTAPGRQADPERLLDVLGHATGAPVRVVSAEDEGRLAYAGAVSRVVHAADVLAVCDVGGGSTEIVVGTPLGGAAWVRSVDVGSLRLTAALLHGDPPSETEIATARLGVGAAFAGLVPPQPELALATGGSARAIARIVGHAYGTRELEQVVRALARRPAERTAKALGVPLHRARTLLAGALVLEEVAGLLGVDFTPARGGIREGLALQLAAEQLAA